MGFPRCRRGKPPNPQTAPLPQAPDHTGRARDGRYELLAVIGEGAFGRVYEGRDRRLRREVAVKVIKPWWGDDPEWARAFEREARLLASVSNPGIVQIYDAGHAAEGLYYVSELVRGEDLATRLRRAPLHPAGACAIAERLCRALAHAHARGIVHRDVKPANVMLSDDGQVKLGDLGIARLAAGSTGGQAAVAGTPRYMAPEQSRGLRSTPATDVYAVGVVLYEMLAGAPPFDGRSVVELALAHERDTPPPLPESVPRALAQIALRALAKNPARRYADGAEMAAALVAAGPRRRSAGAHRSSARPRRAAGAAPAPTTAATRVASAPGATAVTRRQTATETVTMPARRSDRGHLPPARTRVKLDAPRPEPSSGVPLPRSGR
ncbi:MAG: serine/threonine-protein kinase, partial [Solirubrobacteraceae bacterium]